MKMVLHFYKKYFNMPGMSVVLKVNCYTSLLRLCHLSKVYDKIFSKKIPFCY